MQNMGSRVDYSPYKNICTSQMDPRFGIGLKSRKSSSKLTDFGKLGMVVAPYSRMNVG